MVRRKSMNMREKHIIFQESGGKALNPQKKIDQGNFPFTLNVTIGCLFKCLYCYTQGFPFSTHTEFGKEVKVKTWLPGRLDKEMNQYRDLPQHLKIVQVNTASEGYIPEVMKRAKREIGRDIMLETLEVFKRHWENRNHWMLHLLTKSHMIVRHLDCFKDMRNQVQVELTITTLNEERRKILEGFAPSVKKRLKVIETLAKEGIFVRVMAMPFIGTRDETAELKRVVLEQGARAFKHKSLNYWDDKALLEGKVIRVKGRKDFAYNDLLLKSGEEISDNGQVKTVKLPMPDKDWNDWFQKVVPVRNFGYSELNVINWGNNI